MKSFGLARIGRDVEVRYTAGGDAVASLSLAFTYVRKGEDGKRLQVVLTTWPMTCLGK